MGFRFIIFFVLFLVCPYANGARDVSRKQAGIISEPYVTNYGASDEPYVANYGGRKIVKEVEISVPYMTNYGARESAEEAVELREPYMTNYGARGSVKEAEMPYMANYGAKKTEQPYTANYGAKKTEQAYVTNYEAKTTMEEMEVNQPYMTNYGNKEDMKETEASYITQYGDKETETSYITQYGDKEAEASYITQYGDKVAEASYLTQYGDKEAEASYLTQYGDKEAEASYITQYGDKEGESKAEKPVPSAHEHHHGHMHHTHSISRNEAHEQGFFTMVDFYKGSTMPLNFPNQDHSPFLPRKTADSLPFSTSQLPHLLQLFSIPRDSRDAKHMAYTLDQCQQKPIKGETKFCATSLQSMNEFVQKIIGSGIKFNILSTTHPATSTSITQKYTILEEPKQVVASKMVFCHPVPYPYAVFFCHHFETDTRFFQVSLGGENGDKVEAVAVCHMDTSGWNSKLSLFRNLGIKASASSPVCHFFPENHLVWIPAPATATA